MTYELGLLSAVDDGLEWLSDTFTLCKPLANATAVSGLMDWVENTWFDLAMGTCNYRNMMLVIASLFQLTILVLRLSLHRFLLGLSM